MSEPQSSHAMDLALSQAVPMWIMELQPKGFKYWDSRRSICSQTVAEKGDVLMYGSKKKGAAAEVFNRLAEGIALLCLITKGPVPFNKRVYFHDRPSKLFETEEEANRFVWPKVPDVSKTDSGSLQPEAVRTVCSDASTETSPHPNVGATSGGQKDGGENDAT